MFGDTSLQSTISVLAFDVGVLVFSAFLSGILMGLQRFRTIALVSIAVSTLKVLVPVYFLIAGLGLLGVVLGWVAADLTGVLLSLFLVSPSFRKGGVSEDFSFAGVVKYSLPLYGAAIIAYFSVSIDKFVIISLSNLTVLGIYTIAIAAVNAIAIVSSSMSSSLFPQFTQTHGLYGKDALVQASIKASRYVFLIFTPLSIGLASVAHPTLQLFFGEVYTSGWQPIAIVSVTLALTSANVILSNILLSLGMTRTILGANVIGLTMGAAISVLLVSPLGGAGAALGRAVLISASFAYVALKLKKSFGLHLDASAFKKAFICSGIMAVAVVFTQLLLSNNKYLLPLYIAIGCISYMVTLRFLKAVNSQDVQLLKEILPRRFHRLANMFSKFFLPRQ